MIWYLELEPRPQAIKYKVLRVTQFYFPLQLLLLYFHRIQGLNIAQQYTLSACEFQNIENVKWIKYSFPFPLKFILIYYYASFQDFQIPDSKYRIKESKIPGNGNVHVQYTRWKISLKLNVFSLLHSWKQDKKTLWQLSCFWRNFTPNSLKVRPIL